MRRALLGSTSLRGIAAAAVICGASVALANPQGGVVTGGSGTITQTPGRTDIHQHSHRMIVEWQSFSIGAGEITQFHQPSASAIALNRVLGGDPSQILGSLKANGRIILVNPNGVIFGQGSLTDVNSLVATTTDLHDHDFMNGRLDFTIPSDADNPFIANEGEIRVGEGGALALVAPHVRNDGTILAHLAKVELGAGETFTLDFFGDGLLSFELGTDRTITGADGEPVSALVHNAGLIAADGGVVALRAQTVDQVLGQVINTEGVIQANAVTVEGGTVHLFSGADTGGPNGAITVADDITASGGAGQSGGAIEIAGSQRVDLRQDAALDVSGDAAGGSVTVETELAITTGTIDATSESGPGGTIAVTADYLSHTGEMDASGATGGQIDIVARAVAQQGQLRADGRAGAGGRITVKPGQTYFDTVRALASAQGNGGDGGVIEILGQAEDSTVFMSGDATTESAGGVGGRIDVTAGDIALIGANLDASGDFGGGQVRVGGSPRQPGAVETADTLKASRTTTVRADARIEGDGGEAILWSDEETLVSATLTARGGAQGGDGGFLEVSSPKDYAFDGHADASAPLGEKGTFLLDPKNIIIDDTTGGIPAFELVNPNPNAGEQYADTVVALANGNVVVTDPVDDAAGVQAGAVYVFDSDDASLISVITGDSAIDLVGLGGVTELTNGNFVVGNQFWGDGAGPNVGAATWVNGTTGLPSDGAGVVSTANSLYGGTTGDSVGVNVTALSNGNYVVGSPAWDNPVTGAIGAGAATWGNGATGTAGLVSNGNSIVGETNSDAVGTVVVSLTDGDYVVVSSDWDSGVADVGAITWGDGGGGSAGAVSAANSLVGTSANDGDNQAVTVLTNGNYVVLSPDWDNTVSGITDVGAVTWGDGSGGATGAISSGNSLIGTANEDLLATTAEVFALSNGHYVVAAPQWNNGGILGAGAVTWGDGFSGTTGSISTSNSIVGSNAGDQIGQKIAPLTNGNYVIGSPNWSNGGVTIAGAATWADGSGPTSGVVSTANSLYGTSSGDAVSGSITSLSNGNYVVQSTQWTNGGSTMNAGAVTWGNGMTGITGPVTTTNSLYSLTANSSTGTSVFPLSNGNYVVQSPFWNDGAAGSVGAVTWADGGAGATGAISAANSLVGSTLNDLVGFDGGPVGNPVVELSDGNFVIVSSFWDNGGVVNAGAVTWADGGTGVVGSITAANSLVGGSGAGNFGDTGAAETGPIASTDGGYLIPSNNLGAVTYGAASGASTGAVNRTNSFVLAGGGPNPAQSYDLGNSRFVVTDTGGAAWVIDPNAPLTFGGYPTSDVTLHSGVLTNILDTGTAVTLQANNDITINSDIITTTAGTTGGDLTFQAGRSVLVNASIDTDGGDLAIIGNELLSAGVVDAQRDPGSAIIDHTAGVIATQGGDLTITLTDGVGKTNTAAAGITLGQLNAGGGQISVTQDNASDIVIEESITTDGTVLLDAASGSVRAQTNAAINAGAGSFTARGQFIDQLPGAATLVIDASALTFDSVSSTGDLNLSTNASTITTGNVVAANALSIAGDGDLVIDGGGFLQGVGVTLTNVGGSTTVNNQIVHFGASAIDITSNGDVALNAGVNAGANTLDVTAQAITFGGTTTAGATTLAGLSATGGALDVAALDVSGVASVDLTPSIVGGAIDEFAAIATTMPNAPSHLVNGCQKDGVTCGATAAVVDGGALAEAQDRLAAVVAAVGPRATNPPTLFIPRPRPPIPPLPVVGTEALVVIPDLPTAFSDDELELSDDEAVLLGVYETTGELIPGLLYFEENESTRRGRPKAWDGYLAPDIGDQTNF